MMIETTSPTASAAIQSLFCQLPAPALLLDRRGAIVTVNLAFAELLQLYPEQIVGHAATEYLRFGESGRGDHSVAGSVARLRRATDRGSQEFKVSSLPGTSYRLVLACSPETQTYASRREGELQHLFYSISHNLKSPVVSIQGFADLLMETDPDTPLREVRHYLERIQHNALHMNKIIHDILEFSKFSRRAQRFETVDLDEIVTTVQSENLFRLKEKNVRFVRPEALPQIQGDYEGLLTVYANLIDNALKYIGETSEPEIEIGYRDNGRFYTFWVRDNGVGVAEEDCERVFNLFERAGASKQVEGTGVGLAIVKQIVERHGGLVTFRSKPGLGSVVYFTIPK
ncbi:MAG: sensor histidine kinase [Calditrichaeota bacterium]|nr:MAG: sensor histidine kinase [Calditrichota bacterium]